MVEDEALALRRLWIMTLARLAALGVVLTGMWMAGTAAGPRGGSDGLLWGGLLVMLMGLALFFLVPRWLGRRWRG
jgi:hypothetical protein